MMTNVIFEIRKCLHLYELYGWPKLFLNVLKGFYLYNCSYLHPFFAFLFLLIMFLLACFREASEVLNFNFIKYSLSI